MSPSSQHPGKAKAGDGETVVRMVGARVQDTEAAILPHVML